MSLANVQNHGVLATAGECPGCGRNLVVPDECGWCKWMDPHQAREVPEEFRSLGKWSTTGMVVLVLLALIVPLVGLFAAIYGMFDDSKRYQAVFLLLVTLVFGGSLTYAVLLFL